jgi:uncharacterized protein
MKRGNLIIAAAMAMMLAVARPVEAQDFAKGESAYDSGDYATALQQWKPLAYNGNADAQTRVGFLFYKGLGVPKDHVAAANWYTLAAQQGYAPGQAKLGFMYDFGRGVKKSDRLAVQWYRRAADQGNAFAQLSLGKMYAVGRGVRRDDSLAYLWSYVAAEQGSEIGAKNRDSVGRKLTPGERNKMQRLVLKCLGRGYKKCGR